MKPNKGPDHLPVTIHVAAHGCLTSYRDKTEIQLKSVFKLAHQTNEID